MESSQDKLFSQDFLTGVDSPLMRGRPERACPALPVYISWPDNCVTASLEDPAAVDFEMEFKKFELNYRATSLTK
jgi:hypothetical protein